ncbi:hypothetical protein HI914_00298 [Erysiphe necator]|nr:hypothetical protein HI914_00298 [Erysiphe necator]
MHSLFAKDIFRISTPENTFIYDIFRFSKSLAVLSSDDALRLLDPYAMCTESRKISNVGANVTCCTSLDRNNLVAVAGSNGEVRIWDMRSSNLRGSVKTDDSVPIVSMASCSQYVLACGSELINHEASIFLWDLRRIGAPPLLQFNQSHSDDITDLKFHPMSPNILLSGSTDGLINIFNTNITAEEEALYQTFNHGASIHHCNFLNDFDIFALSHDEKFSIYKMLTNLEDESAEREEVHFGDLRGVLGGEYVADVQRRPGGEAVVGIGSHSRIKFDLVQLKGDPKWTFAPDERITLDRAHGSDVVRSFCYFDEHRIIFTGGEDGKVKAWKGD